ncbi:hypothetical protein [Candidatus Tisiphia endosymbiont of Oplodontha viridula]
MRGVAKRSTTKQSKSNRFLGLLRRHKTTPRNDGAMLGGCQK